jgi:hypothetical protein
MAQWASGHVDICNLFSVITTEACSLPRQKQTKSPGLTTVSDLNQSPRSVDEAISCVHDMRFRVGMLNRH